MATKETLLTLDQAQTGHRIALKLKDSELVLRGSVVSNEEQAITVNNGFQDVPVAYENVANIVNWGYRS